MVIEAGSERPRGLRRGRVSATSNMFRLRNKKKRSVGFQVWPIKPSWISSPSSRHRGTGPPTAHILSLITSRRLVRLGKFGGARRNRTADLLNAIQALSQLSYGPYCCNERTLTRRPDSGRSTASNKTQSSFPMSVSMMSDISSSNSSSCSRS